MVEKFRSEMDEMKGISILVKVILMVLWCVGSDNFAVACECVLKKYYLWPELTNMKLGKAVSTIRFIFK